MPKKIRVAAYCRVSTEKEEQLLSLEGQKNFFVDYAGRQGYDLVELYADEGISGTKLKNRAAFLRMMEDAKRGRFEKLLVKDVSRLARNTVDFLQTLRELKAMGIECVFVNANMSTCDGELFLTMMASVAQEESRNLSKRVKFGKKQNAEKGRVPNIIYGYDKIKGQLFSLEVNQKEAEVIRYIYHLYLKEGYGANKIAQILNKQGVKTKRGYDFSQSGICRILTNPIYTGKVVNGREYVEDFLTGKREKREEGEWMVVDNPDLRIISDEDFQASVALMENRNDAFHLSRDRQSNRFPFSTLIKCQECGFSFRRIYRKREKTKDYVKWVCSGANCNGRDFCHNKTIIDEAELLAEIREYLLGIIKNKDKFLEATKAEIRKKYQQDRPYVSEAEVKKEIEKRNRMKQKQIEMFEADVITIAELKERTKRLDMEIEQCQKTLELCLASGNDTQLMKIFHTYCKDIETLLSAETMDNVLLKKIIEKIEVSSNGEIHVKLKIKSTL